MDTMSSYDETYVCESTDSKPGVSRRPGENINDAMERQQHGWCLGDMHQGVIKLRRYIVRCLSSAQDEKGPPFTPGEFKDTVEDPADIRSFAIPFACRAIAPPPKLKHRLPTPRLPTAGVSELAPMLKHRCGPHFCIWCGPASATAPAMVFHSFPAMGIVCDHCDDQLNDHQWSVNSCKTYTGRPFRSMQHHWASKLSRHLTVSPENAQMIAEFVYPSWWPFSCHEYVPEYIHRIYYQSRFPEVHVWSRDIPDAWAHAVQDKVRKCKIAIWMEHRGLIEKNVKELESLYKSNPLTYDPGPRDR